jgi:hypothetical protein
MALSRRAKLWTMAGAAAAGLELINYLMLHQHNLLFPLLLPIVSPVIMQYLNSSEAISRLKKNGQRFDKSEEPNSTEADPIRAIAEWRVTSGSLVKFGGVSTALCTVASCAVYVLNPRHPALSVLFAIGTVLSLIAAVVLRSAYPGRAVQESAVDAIDLEGSGAMNALLWAALDFDEPARSYAASHLVTVLEEAIHTEEPGDQDVMLRLADALPRLNAQACTAALALFQARQAAYLLPSIARFVRRIHRHPEAEAMRHAAEACLLALEEANASQAPRTVLLRASTSDQDNGSLLRAPQKPADDSELLRCSVGTKEDTGSV